MAEYYLAIDIGSSSGRHMLGCVRDGKIAVEEIYRFDNRTIRKDGHLYWDYKKLFQDIKAGIKKCGEIGKIPKSIGIDTWGCDYVLLDERDEVLGGMYAYRDTRTEGMDKEVYRIIPEEELYARTGLEKLICNTIYQLMADKKQRPDQLQKAEALLFVPDYFHFLLTGEKVSEYTEASTSQLMRTAEGAWDGELIREMGYPEKIFQKIGMPGEKIGTLRPELIKEFGFDMDVVLPCAHDTASAILAVPANDDDYAFISSGTWSLLGVERDKPDCTDFSFRNHFTNEGGYGGRICYHRNINGLWMIQEVRHNLNDAYSFAKICEEAEKASAFPSRVDVSDDSFLAPDNMIEAIRKYCQDTGQDVPETLGEIGACVYASLAECYAKTIRDIEAATKRTYSKVHIVGGGGNAGYLNELTAKATGKEVHVGPTEGTALGNLAAQMIYGGEFKNKEAVRQAIHDSFDVKIYRT